MLSKYHSLPDHFHDLKTTLQAKLNLLKKATSKNIQNIQEAVQSQQAYTTALCGHINSLYTKLAQLDKQVQIHCLYPHPQLDVIQLNAPDYDPDIDEQLDPVTDVQSSKAETAKEDTPLPPDTSKSEHRTAISLTTNRPEPQPSEVSADTDHPEYHSGEQPQAEHTSNCRPQLEDIPELEIDEENWDKGQFEELIECHNTTEESDRIRCEYSAHFEKITDQEYNPYHSTTQGFEYQIPETDYYHTDT